MSTILDELSQAVIKGDAVAVKELTEKALAEGIDPQSIFGDSIIPAMNEVGRRMETEEYFIPEVLLSCRAVKSASEILKPLISQGKTVKPEGRVVIGTVQGDVHDIGKNLVMMMLEGVGFEVIDLGIDVPTERFVEKVRDARPDIVAMSALLTMTTEKMVEVIQSLSAAGYRENLIIMVGGAPVNQEFAVKIGADGFAPDAGGAARLAKELLASRSK
ncbi:B12-binding domain-containing protein [Chloroflexota bacterium]